MGGAANASRFISEVRWSDLPEPVREKARMCFVDSLGATLAGSLARVSGIGLTYATRTWPGAQATALADGTRLSTLGAAFANGCASNAIDIDDSARYAYGHAGAQIFPTALSLAEGQRFHGSDLLCAMVVGYEIAHRVGRCWHASHDIYQACGSWGSVACAASAAHLLRLTQAQTLQALGIAEYHAPNLPMMRDIDHPAMVKHGLEWAAVTGITAADLARRGYTGIPSILNEPCYQDWVGDIGTEFQMVDGVAWKAERYACCGWAHAGVEGARRLVLEHDIAPDDIASILVEGCHGSMRLGARLPVSMEEAQFSQAWPIAAMLLDGEIGPAQILDDRLNDPALRSLASRVKVVESEEIEALCRLFEQGDPSGRFASRVTITLHNGQRLESGCVDGGLRFPQDGWDRARMTSKFVWLASHLMAEDAARELAGRCWSIDAIDDLGELVQDVVRSVDPGLRARTASRRM